MCYMVLVNLMKCLCRFGCVYLDRLENDKFVECSFVIEEIDSWCGCVLLMDVNVFWLCVVYYCCCSVGVFIILIDGMLFLSSVIKLVYIGILCIKFLVLLIGFMIYCCLVKVVDLLNFLFKMLLLGWLWFSVWCMLDLIV